MKEVKIKLEGGIMPKKANPADAAWDLYIPENVELHSGRQVIDLKFSMELPQGYAATIQPRSGFSCKGFSCIKIIRNILCIFFGGSHGSKIDADVIRGLVDEKYRGHIGVIVKSRYWSPFYKAVIPRGTRIAQMQIVKVPEVDLVEVTELDMSNDRGGGFGHTGVR